MKILKHSYLLTALILLLVTGCESAYYGAMEKVGVHKRDILVDRIEEVQEAQLDAKEEFTSALQRFSEKLAFDGGDLEKTYNSLNDAYLDSKSRAETLSTRIDDVENVADALFEEWQEEITQYSNASLRRQSESQLRTTQTHYKKMLSAMQSSEKKMQPVLTRLNDQVLFLKHNLNARAINSLETEFSSLKKDIAVLIRDMENSIREADQFMATLKQ